MNSEPTGVAGQCRRTPAGLELCKAMDLAAVDHFKHVGIQVLSSMSFNTGELTQYVGVRRSAKEKVLLFNVCPFCRFEYAVGKDDKP